MPVRALNERLVWITHTYGVNPDSIAMVFHGLGGQVEISFFGGLSKSLHERDLTDDGRALLLPPEQSRAATAAAAAAAAARPPERDGQTFTRVPGTQVVA